MVKTSFEKFKEKDKRESKGAKNFRINYKSEHSNLTSSRHNDSLHEDADRTSHTQDDPTPLSNESIYLSSTETNEDRVSREQFNEFEDNIRKMPIVELIRLMKKKSAGGKLTAEEEKMILNIEHTDLTKAFEKKFKLIRNIIILIFLFAFLKNFF